jgi:hypothetical protein
MCVPAARILAVAIGRDGWFAMAQSLSVCLPERPGPIQASRSPPSERPDQTTA